MIQPLFKVLVLKRTFFCELSLFYHELSWRSDWLIPLDSRKVFLLDSKLRWTVNHTRWQFSSSSIEKTDLVGIDNSLWPFLNPSSRWKPPRRNNFRSPRSLISRLIPLLRIDRPNKMKRVMMRMLHFLMIPIRMRCISLPILLNIIVINIKMMSKLH